MTACTITRHAYHRAKQRLGLKPHSLDRMIDRIYFYGMSITDTRGAVYHYLVELTERGGSQSVNQLRIYGDNLYLFADQTLITLYQLPTELLPKVARIRERFRQRLDQAA